MILERFPEIEQLPTTEKLLLIAELEHEVEREAIMRRLGVTFESCNTWESVKERLHDPNG